MSGRHTMPEGVSAGGALTGRIASVCAVSGTGEAGRAGPPWRPPSAAATLPGRTSPWEALGVSLKTAVGVFAVQRGRTLLAVLGVFLGALLLTAITHVLGSVTLQVENQARDLGSHLVTVTVGHPAFSRAADKAKEEEDATEDAEGAATAGNAPETAATLTPADFEAVMLGLPYVGRGTPYVLFSGQAHAAGASSTCEVMGVRAGYAGLKSMRPVQGRFFTPEEDERARPVCVLGHTLAARLFGDPASATGSHIRLERSSVLVLGVMGARGADSGGTNMDEIVFLPLRTAMQRFSSRDHVSGLLLEMHEDADRAALGRSLEALLRTRHRIPAWQTADFTVALGGQVDEMFSGALGLMTLLGLLGAGISFGVGSLGIFSIMILMVHARKTEIGIRRAVGATRGRIRLQFLCEAGLMAGTGGLAGVAVALAGVRAAAAMDMLFPYVNIPLALGVCALSVLCGLLAGGYPAWKASRLEILAVLRQSG